MQNYLKQLPSGQYYYCIESLGDKVKRLPISLRIILESLLRNYDGKKIKEKDILSLVNWQANQPEDCDIPFIVSRVILQDLTGVPLLVDLAAMRDAAVKMGLLPEEIEPKVAVDLVIDHSVQVDKARSFDALQFNIEKEFQRNHERYEFLKWGQQAFKTFRVIPPGTGIVHQINLENLATCVTTEEKEGKTILYPDTLVGTDSHTPMINGIGVLGWGVGGIEAEAAMLGLPTALQMPEVIGVYLTGRLSEGVTATDLTLTLTKILRQENVVGKFVEFFGDGAESLTVSDRAAIANMAPEYGATIGFFPCDEKTVEYLTMTGRDEDHIQTLKMYLTAQNLFGMPQLSDIDYTKIVRLDLGSIIPSVAGPKRPQDLIALTGIQQKFRDLLSAPVAEGGYAVTKPMILASSDDRFSPFPVSQAGRQLNLTHGSVVIAAITSCTNTSNPAVMISAGLLAKKAVLQGLKVLPHIKTSLAPGSRVVTDYLEQSGLLPYLEQLGFHVVAYGCTTCIGNSGPLSQDVQQEIESKDLVVASVLSGNRNFEARIHSQVKANFLMSPPLVIAFALAARVDINFALEPLGYREDHTPIFLKDIWPSNEEIEAVIQQHVRPHLFEKRYGPSYVEGGVSWQQIQTHTGPVYHWNEKSTYIQPPPYFDGFTKKVKELDPLQQMKALAVFADSVTTDHISPAGAFSKNSAAGTYLLAQGVEEKDFNSYGSRRGNHHVMVRGTFANIRLKNQLAEGKEGSFTKLMPEGKILPIFTACEIYRQRKTPLVIFAGNDYGMGSSRDWAAKGSKLLGVKAVIAKSFERIHRSNLIGMGILPLQFLPGQDVESLHITGHETFTLEGINSCIKPHEKITLCIEHEGSSRYVQLVTRLDNKAEIEYYVNGGILPYVLRQMIGQNQG